MKPSPTKSINAIVILIMTVVSVAIFLVPPLPPEDTWMPPVQSFTVPE